MRQTTVITARVAREVGELVRQAAVIRGCPTSKIVESGSLKEAQLILDQAARTFAQVRKSARQVKAQKAGRAGGVARAAKRKR